MSLQSDWLTLLLIGEAMKKLDLFFFLIAHGVLLTGCDTYSFQSVYPQHYQSVLNDDEGKLPLDLIGEDLLETLPVEFNLAYYSGHLWCIRDMHGELKSFKLDKAIQTTLWSMPFSDGLEKAKRDKNFKVFTPIAYPNIYCVMPNVDVRALFDESWLPEWLDYVKNWESLDIENQRLSEANNKLISEIQDTNRAIITINQQIAQYEEDIKKKNEAIKSMEEQIKEKNNILSGIGNYSLMDDNLKKPPFELKGNYDKSKDPFLTVLVEYMRDISDKPWAGDGMMGGKYIDPELADKVQEVNDAFSDPSSIQEKELKDAVTDLKNKGFTGIVLTSGARTPLRQAYLYANKSSNANPVGKYLYSDHMFGQAGDMAIPGGWNWSSENHKKLRSVMDKFGLSMNVANDPPHFVLGKPSRAFYARRLAMVRAYHKRAIEVKAAQGAVKENAIFEQAKMTEQKSALETQFGQRKDELQKQSDIFTRVSATYLKLQREMQLLDAEIARRRAEKQKGDAEGPSTGRWDRPRPESPGHAPEKKDPPSRDAPKKDPPSRDLPRREPGLGKPGRLGLSYIRGVLS